MMADAKVRDQERSKNVKDYHKEDTEEETKNKSAATKGSGGFIR